MFESLVDVPALLVDRISVILRASRDAVGPAPTLFNRAGGEARIGVRDRPNVYLNADPLGS